MTKLLLSVLFFIMGSAFAQPHKCVTNGKTEYTDRPCPEGTDQPLSMVPPPTEAERQQAGQRVQTQKQRANELEAARKVRDAQAAPVQTPLNAKNQPPETVSPEEAARQGAAGRNYVRERPDQAGNRPEVKPSPVIPFPIPTPR